MEEQLLEEELVFCTFLEDVLLEEETFDSWEDGLELVELEQSIGLEDLCWVSMEDKCINSVLEDCKRNENINKNK